MTRNGAAHKPDRPALRLLRLCRRRTLRACSPLTDAPSSPRGSAAFDRHVADEHAKWGEVVRAAGIRSD